MLPIENIYTYFYIILSGFMTVWTFRRVVGLKEKITEFEYLGFSAFWGILILIAYNNVAKVNPTDLLSNPFNSGIFLSIEGIIFALILGGLYNLVKFAIKFFSK